MQDYLADKGSSMLSGEQIESKNGSVGMFGSAAANLDTAATARENPSCPPRPK
ncbi:uncharacterized protein MYCFIDRAFT_183054 [Pseudocercospora fijiensis CIRAD86]|uniref:Uncharacterized protein n=1 Tax=Pseudocercospora fijiensis (strain CIRAD86) TaxID=383855 RepID=M2ZT84_PSEFD|nr:uncharacterized protein MYCFIDRAFT_183054 [Pseudocercospora fijiensis CIRAD86]EME82224.1 hypothetical protein MYCFIDRAFT_183054 [Pseudocercospora fijiensis CIRAD86]